MTALVIGHQGRRNRQVDCSLPSEACVGGQRIDPSWQDGSVGGIGIAPETDRTLNRRIDEAADLPALEKETDQIRASTTLNSSTTNDEWENFHSLTDPTEASKGRLHMNG